MVELSQTLENNLGMGWLLTLYRPFFSLSTDKTGKISLDNLRSVCRDHGLKLSDQELKDMIQEADLDGDGKVNPSEFVKIMQKTNLF